jgi:hypothetical protein
MGGNSIIPPAASSSSSGGGRWFLSSRNTSSTSLAASKEYVIEGTCHETGTWTKGPAGATGVLTGTKLHDVTPTTGLKKEEAVVVAGEASRDMGEIEMRKLWEIVAKAIREGGFEIANKEKSRIEVGYLVVCSSNFADPVYVFVE